MGQQGISDVTQLPAKTSLASQQAHGKVTCCLFGYAMDAEDDPGVQCNQGKCYHIRLQPSERSLTIVKGCGVQVASRYTVLHPCHHSPIHPASEKRTMGAKNWGGSSPSGRELVRQRGTCSVEVEDQLSRPN
ncbi:uncharacterized protein PADG_11898 [Paracoccidioides brasiliensis Pb18]|uniref:Uncharacterized protein n=1 Tax=Paracoccidioides brasiliensis (strain Pb18) TaxID=502780 RepID=A0A0A0HWZ4_PARBD|nr:uncharacterized protein PADG_11898 [Paracoccidioides brasiliensis Pb18]KGM91925.1 hypothetical protein PADG_11898 [Paracoccidioides brasiliensis Pb18]